MSTSADEPDGTRRSSASDGVICLAGVDWWYHNRGHSECQIMRRLAERTPVLWVNSIGMRAPIPGKSEISVRRYWRKLKSSVKGLRRDSSGMWIYSPFFVPRYTPRVAAFNGWLLHQQLRLLKRRIGMRRPSVWITLPTFEPALRRGRWKRAVFNRSDDFASFPEVDEAFVRSLETRLLDRCDEVVYVNRKLFEAERNDVRSAQLLSHGVDYDHFADAATQPNNPPESVRHLPRPIVGFYGALDDYTVDLDLMVRTARQIAPGTLLVIGPQQMNINRLLAEDNVVYLGPVPYEELPSYAACFDVGIMPWLNNTWIENCNPIKLKEYLAIGFPIVSIRFPELEPYLDLVYPAATSAEFIDSVSTALAETDLDLPTRRRQAVAQSSWDSVADRVADLLDLA